MAAAIVFVAAAALVIPLVGLARVIAPRIGMLDHPIADRLHTTSRPYLGGVAIAVAAIVVTVVAVSVAGWHVSEVVLVAAAMTVMLLGLWDDARRVSWRPKLAIQALAAVAVVVAGLVIPVTGWLAVDAVLTFVGIVILTNSFNLIDNSDAALASVTLVVGIGVGLVAAVRDAPVGAVLAVATAGAAAGYLPFNWPPASIFMGDAGSLFIGFVLVASLGAIGLTAGMGLAVGLALMVVPLADTTTVVITRRREGRSIMAGGVDHLHHRFKRQGLGAAGAPVTIAAMAAIGAALAVLCAADVLPWPLAAVLAVAIWGGLTAVALRMPSAPTTTGGPS